MADGAFPTGEEANLISTINAIVRISIAATIVLTFITAALEVRRFVRIGARRFRRPERPRAGGTMRAMPDPKPRFIPPMLATLVAAPFDDPDWLFEIKWDGFRVEAVVEGRGPPVDPRPAGRRSDTSGHSSTPPTWIDAREAIVDGEVIAFGHGEPDFALLQARSGRRGRRAPTRRLRGVRSPLARRALAARGRSRSARRCSRGVLREDPRCASATTSSATGSPSSRPLGCAASRASWPRTADSPYLPGARSGAWHKVKIRPEQELVVGGWTPGRAPRPISAPSSSASTRAAPSATRARSAPGSPTRHRAELLAALAPLARRGTAVRAAPPRRRRREREWVQPSSSSGPSSRAGPATAWSARRPTRVSTRQGSSRRSPGAPAVSPAGLRGHRERGAPDPPDPRRRRDTARTGLRAPGPRAPSRR